MGLSVSLSLSLYIYIYILSTTLHRSCALPRHTGEVDADVREKMCCSASLQVHTRGESSPGTISVSSRKQGHAPLSISFFAADMDTHP